MGTMRICSGCQKPLALNAPDGLCPACLMKAGMDTGMGVGPDSEAEGRRMAFVAPTLEEIARLFPQLEILAFIGQGGMGVVCKARQQKLDRVVALKVMPPQMAQQPGFAERFTREAHAMARLNHPNIVTLYDYGETGGHYYLIMEFVDGVSLRQMELAQRLTPAEALSLVPKICDALQYAHEEGIVHRDIKPENILIDKRGRVKIADFGLAKLLGRDQSKFRLTGSNTVMGTLHYMAPEQVEHPADVDNRADIYSLGVVFYEMLTGELPIGRFPSPSEKVQVDVRLDEIVLRSLAKEPGRRYQLVSEVKTDIETISHSMPSLSPKMPVITGYEILAELSSSQTCKTYKARHLALGRLVMLKILSPEAAGNARFLERFRREAQAAASLNHPNLVRVYESRESEGLHFIAMEYIGGETLGDRLERKGRVAPREAMAICVYVAQALAHGWSTVKLIHRDIKPDNIFLSESGEVKLGDFGCACSAVCEDERLRRPGESFGTPNYLSPEQARGDLDVDFRTDIYCLGGTLYHMLCGQPPYDGPNAAEVMRKHVTEPPPAILDVFPECPKEIASLLSRMLAKDPRERYASHEDLIEELLHIHGRLEGESVTNLQKSVPAKRTVMDFLPAAWNWRVTLGLAVVTLGLITATAWFFGARLGWLRESAPTSAGVAPLAGLQTGQPWTNSLGMKFVPVAGTPVLFSIWDTRVQDYQAFASATGRRWTEGILSRFEQGPTHPAAWVSWEDAQDFCQWLTEKERSEGRLRADQGYRLPTDLEWSTAAGLDQETGSTVTERSAKIADIYPWGTQWPPPRGAGNYGSELNVDDFAKTSPVGSFAASRFGLYDMGGNVCQWCEDCSSGQSERVLRGSAWSTVKQQELLSSYRRPGGKIRHVSWVGFRCVLAPCQAVRLPEKTERGQAGRGQTKTL